MLISFSMCSIWRYWGSKPEESISAIFFNNGKLSSMISMKLFYGIPVPGYTSLFASITFFIGIQLLILGIIGEYLGIIIDEVKRRPIYIVEEMVNDKKQSWIYPKIFPLIFLVIYQANKPTKLRRSLELCSLKNYFLNEQIIFSSCLPC